MLDAHEKDISSTEPLVLWIRDELTILRTFLEVEFKKFFHHLNTNFMTTLQELIQQRDALNLQIAEMQQALRSETLAEIRATMREFQIRIEDLGSAGKSDQRTKIKAAPKYRNPETGKTWSGRGKRPQWIHDALADGQSLDKYLI